MKHSFLIEIPIYLQNLYNHKEAEARGRSMRLLRNKFLKAKDQSSWLEKASLPHPWSIWS